VGFGRPAALGCPLPSPTSRIKTLIIDLKRNVMKSRFTLSILALLFAACASAGGPPATPGAPPARDVTPPPAAAPAPPPAPAPTPAPAPEPVIDGAPDGWQNLDLGADGVPGTSSERALAELLADREPAGPVLVAVIDGGVDTAHVDLRDAMWRNPGETPGNGRDDDDNGYVDDVYGWNFLGGSDGRNVDQDTYELTRLHALCLADGAADEYDCAAIATEYGEMRSETEGLLQQIEEIEGMFAAIMPALRQATGRDELTDEIVEAIQTPNQQILQMRQAYLQLSEAGIDEELVAEVKKDAESRAQYGLDTDFDPRPIVGDDYANGDERRYGNGDVTGPGPDHGTHVAGIIAGARNGQGNNGIAAPHVRIMAVRAVPDGDERDKDVANAIRYAVDRGARIINMSFGKGFSPRKHLVDEAIQYADDNGVLLVHAAGNDGHDLEVEANFPTPAYSGGGSADLWITVGASGWKSDSLATSFSNYGRTKVDVFAPGIDILSAEPGDGWVEQQGTSMAAPVVTGVAALLMAYFPDLTAAEVKEILLESSVKYADRMVPQPGEPSPTGAPGPMVRFGDLSVSGGVVNAYEAVKLALERGGK
jgi:subtilisin family serine protease